MKGIVNELKRIVSLLEQLVEVITTYVDQKVEEKDKKEAEGSGDGQ